MKRVKKVIIGMLVGTMLVTPCVPVSASVSDTNVVYLSNAQENQYTLGGLTVHEYIWDDEKTDDISFLSELTDAEWMKTKLDNGYTIWHRAAREYCDSDTKWKAAAQSRSYNKKGKMDGPIRTTVKVVNSVFTGKVYETQTSGLKNGNSYAKTKKSFLANEPLYSMRSYWSTKE